MTMLSSTSPGAVPAAVPSNGVNGRTIPPSLDGAHAQVLELDTAIVDTPESNRAIPLDSLTGLMESIKTYGQLVLGIVARHPDKPGRWLCPDGNRRLMVCRILGLRFKAVEHKGKITPGSLAATRIAANRTQKQLTDDELANDLATIMDEDGCTQADAARKCGLSASEGSKILSFELRAIAEVKQAVLDKRIVRDTARAISTVPVERQKELLERAISLNMRSDAVEMLARQIRGKKLKKVKSVKLEMEGVTLVIGVEDAQKVSAALAQVDAALKKLEKNGLPLAALPQLVRG